MEKIKVTMELTPEELLKFAAYWTDPAPTAEIKLDVPDADPASIPTNPFMAGPLMEDAEAVQAENEKAPTKADLRALGVKLTKAGKTEALKEAFAKYGAKKLGEIKEADYGPLYADLEVILNA